MEVLQDWYPKNVSHYRIWKYANGGVKYKALRRLLLHYYFGEPVKHVGMSSKTYWPKFQRFGQFTGYIRRKNTFSALKLSHCQFYNSGCKWVTGGVKKNEALNAEILFYMAILSKHKCY